MTYGMSRTLDLPFEDAVKAVREALQDQGFGVLTEIDVTATLKTKLDEDMEDYVILGACNPPLAHRALGVDRSIGLLLPCNVVVRTVADGTMVEIADPQMLVGVTGDDDLEPVAAEAGQRLEAVLSALG
jgi:uncharacterized protein (DUF302 family)